jgi:asparagine synthetase B (glutamine-hydrolysing)
LGRDKVATGDGSNELFGGYSFMKDIDDLELKVSGK